MSLLALPKAWGKQSVSVLRKMVPILHYWISNYAASKAGVAALSTTWARELSRYQIRSAAIASDVFETEMITSMKPDAQERVTSMIPLRRAGKLDDLAGTVKFIVENDYINGRVIELDGGLRL